MLPTYCVTEDGTIGSFGSSSRPMQFAISRQEAFKLIEIVNNHLKMYPTDESVNMFNDRQWKIRDEQLEREEIANQSKKKPKTGTRGYVYLMEDTVNDFIKIGFSKKPTVRESTLQSEKPTVSIVFTALASLEYERELHAAFDDRRIRGEWFDISKDEVIDFISKNQPQSL